MPSRLEVNFSRLLYRLEEMAEEPVDPSNWRFEKYLNALRKQLNDLNSDSSALRPSHEQLKQYQDKLEFLEQYWFSCQASTVEQKSTLTSSLSVPPATRIDPLSEDAEPSGDSGANVRHRVADIAARSRGAVHEEMRRELFGEGEEENAAVDRQEQLQERLAEGMIDMARVLKETAAAAGKVVRADTVQIDAATRQVDANTDRLSTESKRLEILANKSAAVCSCTVWLGLVLVTFTFVSMVVFIRFFPKG